MSLARRGPSSRRGLVLLVEDYRDCREMYAASLTLDGFEVMKARDGIEALELAHQTCPDVVLMDLSLPGMDGFEVTRRLKSEPRTSGIPVVALTAQCLSLLEGKSAGFEKVIGKPCLPDELAAAVGDVLAHVPPRPTPA